MPTDFFPLRPATHPMIYAYEDTNPQYRGLLKVGYTTVDVDRRVAQQYPTKRPDGSVPYRIVLRESAMYPDGSSFDDHDVHRLLERKGVQRVGGEWFRCTVQEVLAALVAVRSRTDNVENRTQTFSMRPEQAEAVNRTIAYYRSAYEEGSNRTPKFLWNAKMRFGKTFASYELAKKMGFKRVLILTFKPAVQTAWREDLMTHVDFEGWQFISRDANNLQDTINDQYQRADKNRPIVCFGSFQDFLGVNKETGGIKANNEWVHTTNWDLVIFDEYHFGAWKENARKLFEQDEDNYDEDLSKYDRGNAYDETWLPITTIYYLYLSGTPFRALNTGEFIEEQIYNWTYSDEQRAKENWVGEDNPYAALPRMVLYSLNPNDDEGLNSVIGCFQDGTPLGRIQQGSAWWFNDHKAGMVKQLTAFANGGLLGNFIGMLTDSRSFLSYPRHEYFRRILCELLGAWVENGEYPADWKALEKMVRGVCYNNAVEFFGFPLEKA